MPVEQESGAPRLPACSANSVRCHGADGCALRGAALRTLCNWLIKEDCIKCAITYSGEDSGVKLDISSCVGTANRQDSWSGEERGPRRHTAQSI